MYALPLHGICEYSHLEIQCKENVFNNAAKIQYRIMQTQAPEHNNLLTI